MELDFIKIQKIIDEKGLRMSYVIEKLGIERTTWYYWRTGARKPRRYNAERLCEVLDIKLEDVEIGGEM